MKTRTKQRRGQRALRQRGHLEACGVQRGAERDDSETATPGERGGGGIDDGGGSGVTPLAEDELQVSGDALEDDGGDGDERAVLHAGGEDSVILGEEEGCAKCRVLCL